LNGASLLSGALYVVIPVGVVQLAFGLMPELVVAAVRPVILLPEFMSALSDLIFRGLCHYSLQFGTARVSTDPGAQIEFVAQFENTARVSVSLTLAQERGTCRVWLEGRQRRFDPRKKTPTRQATECPKWYIFLMLQVLTR